MKIAVTYENGQVFQHFGHTEEFKIYLIENNQIKETSILKTNGQGHGALAGFLIAEGVNVLICGGLGSGAQEALTEANITFYGGVSGNADEAVKKFIANELKFDPNVHCDHHEEGHNCSGKCNENKNGCKGN